MKKITYFLVFQVLLIGCVEKPMSKIDHNPAADGFNAEASDAKAIAIADSVMLASGGRATWDATEIIKWNFFGRRTLEWNKKLNTVKVTVHKDSTIMNLNLNSKAGMVTVKGVPLDDKMSKDSLLLLAEKIWVNDSYWLVLPFKLKDSGVTLKYLGEDKTAAEEDAHKLELTFNEVGFTPENKYEVLVSKSSHLLREWKYYPNYTDSLPRFTMPWDDYNEYEGLMLSGDRGAYKLTEIEVINE